MVSPASVSLPRLPTVVEVGRRMHARDPRVIQATHQRVGQMGQIGTKCVLEGRSGHASVFGTKVSRWQGDSFTPGSHMAQANVPGQSLFYPGGAPSWTHIPAGQHPWPVIKWNWVL